MNVKLIESKIDFDILTKALRAVEYAGLDTETYGVVNSNLPKVFRLRGGLKAGFTKVRFIQIKPFTKSTVYVIDWGRITDNVRDDVLNIFSSNEHITWVGHNLAFDLTHLINEGFNITIKTKFADTMLMHKIVTAGLPEFNDASLKACLKRHCDIDVSKEFQIFDWSGKLEKLTKVSVSDKAIEYLVNDVRYLEPLFNVLSVKCKPYQIITRLENRCLFVTAMMQAKGFYIDLDYFEYLCKKYKERLKELQIKLSSKVGAGSCYAYFDEEASYSINAGFNLMSSQQFLAILQEFGVRDPDTGDILTTTSKDVLDRIDISQYHPDIGDIIESMQEYRAIHKSIANVVSALIFRIDLERNRICSDYGQLSADTGRYTSAKPNLQNIPRESEVRKIFCAPKGKKLVIADYSQIEVRMIAEISGDENLISIYNEGKDLYKMVASNVFDVPYDNVSKEQRQKAKVIVLGFQYGMGAQKFYHYANSLGSRISLKEAEIFRTKFFNMFPTLAKWHSKVKGELKIAKSTSKYYESHTPLGRVRKFVLDSDILPINAAINTPVQGASADMIKAAAVIMYDLFHENSINGYITNLVHDEIIVEVDEDQAEKAKELVEAAMIKAGFFMKKVPIKVEATIASNWSEKA